MEISTDRYSQRERYIYFRKNKLLFLLSRPPRRSIRDIGVRGRSIRDIGVRRSYGVFLFIMTRSRSNLDEMASATLVSQMNELGITEDDIEEQFIRGTGAGGQKINKTSSCVYLRHLPTGIEIKCQASRRRSKNRLTAREMLCEKLQALRDSAKLAKDQARHKRRQATRHPSRKEKARMIEEKRIRSQRKRSRRMGQREES